MRKTLNPFLYGRPVPIERHIDREIELRKIFSRIKNKESTAIVGNPQIGKTSLIQYLLSEKVMKMWLNDLYEDYIFPIQIDVYAGWLSSEKTPLDIWRFIFGILKNKLSNEDLISSLSKLRSLQYSSEALVEYFEALGNNGKRILLVIDEFDSLLYHPNFSNNEFFGILRSLATRTDGLQLITSSITSVEEMNEYSNKLHPTGSPFFNNFVDVNLGLFDDASINKLIDSSLEDTGIEFDQADREYITQVSGRHPYRLQVTAAALFESKLADVSKEERYLLANHRVISETKDHFKQIWKRLDDNAKTVLVIMVALHYKGYVLGKEYSFGEIEKSRFFSPELETLSNLGLVKKLGNNASLQIDFDNYLVWRGQKWQISCESVAWWLSNVVIGGSREIPDFNTWISNQEVVGYLLTRKQWKGVKEFLSKAPETLGKSFSAILVEFLKGFLRKDK